MPDPAHVPLVSAGGQARLRALPADRNADVRSERGLSARRRGLGSHLLGEFLHHVQSNGGREVFLEVRESNRAARELYEKWAFIEAGRRKSYYQDPPEDALVLKFYFPQGG